MYRLNKKYKKAKVGAPTGLYVHWVWWAMPGEFLKAYLTDFSPKEHNYRFSRYRNKTLIDEFLVVRTSKRCYRVIYYNRDYSYFRYFSCANYRECIERLVKIYRLIKQCEEVKEQEPQKISNYLKKEKLG